MMNYRHYTLKSSSCYLPSYTSRAEPRELVLCGWPLDKDSRTSRPVLFLFTLPVLAGKHVDQVTSQRVVLFGKPPRLIATVLHTYIHNVIHPPVTHVITHSCASEWLMLVTTSICFSYGLSIAHICSVCVWRIPV